MNKRHSFITGAIILGISGVVAKFLGLFFRWPVTMLIGDEGIGLYQLAYPIYIFIIGILSGFPIAISSMVSQRTALGKSYQAYRVFKVSFYILIFIGTISSVLLYLGAPFLIEALRWRHEAYYSLVAVSGAPLFVAIMYCFRGYFQGLQMMVVPAASQVVEQFGRIIVGVGLTYILMPRGISLSAAGASFGACAGAVFGCTVLICSYIKNRRVMICYQDQEDRESIINIMRCLMSTAIPISIGMTMASMMALIDSVVVPRQLLEAGFSEKMATELYGRLTGKAHVLVNVPLTLSTALGTSLVPAISEVKALRSFSRVKGRAEGAVKIALLMGLPSSAGLFILADPILHLVFPGRSQGAEALELLSLSVVFIVLAQTLVSVLHGVGDVISPIKNLAVGSLLKLVLCYVLTAMPALNIRGAAISSIVGNMAAAILNFKDASARTYLSFDMDKMLLRPLFSTIVMGIITYISYNKMMNFTGSNGISTITSIITGIIVYIFMALAMGCISSSEFIGYIKYRKRKA